MTYLFMSRTPFVLQQVFLPFQPRIRQLIGVQTLKPFLSRLATLSCAFCSAVIKQITETIKHHSPSSLRPVNTRLITDVPPPLSFINLLVLTKTVEQEAGIRTKTISYIHTTSILIINLKINKKKRKISIRKNEKFKN